MVKTLVNNEMKQAGNYTLLFNGDNLSSGLYYYIFQADGYSKTRRMMLLK